ncbi:phage tail fiber protein [Caulobacter segnis]|uniref:Uncharacterized protein n=1 Tax=Caulobacter segnis TaxID=88688 RepID=A0A2W5VAX1_9CAUL|nr:phage tail fiber protein [Caulobacter segnis]PZR35777.1 MAG: hypothetical protein DI526_05675 [Caulobacter segnis]
MYLTHVSYVAQVDQREFDVTFEYLAPDHVKVTANNSPVPYQWVNESRIRLVNPVGAGTAITIRRETPIDRALVSFQDGAVLTQEDLNKATRQVLFSQQEILDLYKSSLSEAQIRLGNNLGIVTDPAAVMDELAQMVLADELLADLKERLDDINLTADTLIAEQLRTHDLKMGVNVVRDELKVVKDATGTLASVVDLLVIQEPDGDSLVLREDKVFRGNGQSYAQAFEAIQTNIASTQASIVTLQEATIGPDGAVARLRQRLGVEDPSGAGFILNDNIVKLSGGTSLAQTVSGLTSRIGSAEAGIIANNTAISNETSARATAINGVIARVGQTEASITTLQQADTALGVKYGVALNVNGYVTGFLQNNNGSSGSFTVVANRFAIVDPNGGTPIVPFEVSGGVVRAPYIVAGDIFANTITANKIVDLSVGTTKIADNAVTNGASAFSSGYVTCAPGSSSTLQSVGMSTNGGRVQISLSYYLNPVTWAHNNSAASQVDLVTINLYRNGSLVQSVRGGVAMKMNEGNYLLPGGLQAVILNDSPPAGWNFYEVAASCATSASLSSGVLFQSRALNLLETKK